MAKVLLVDDDRDALEIRKRIFEMSGHQISAADSAPEARTQFETSQPETVVLDLRIPELADGLSLIREFRAAAPDLRIVILAGLPSDLDGRAELDLVDVVIGKPVRSEVLLRAVQSS